MTTIESPPVTDELLFQHGTTHVCRLRLAPGEAMAWHTDPCRRVAVVMRGDTLLIEYRDGTQSQRMDVAPGQVEWEQPTDRIHRAVNVARESYEQVTVFLLDHPDDVAQPNDEQHIQREVT